ncbi:dolichyl-phosphate beta-glucosyltransferase [Allorhizocola rhizosphaerae]|uniref:dolichyl-phosphate beta-glucosyltransferase n=1 Tax=Allorhizocola rhizosphaerae TaxID=1872709 RepID=UPI001B8AC024|nr:dolichyl-phosphate beta-glucosyltransferase [Allorhizocola rhizosphaerae]
MIIPAFNEQRRIGPSIEAIRAYLDSTGRAWELIVVDDGSTDHTASVVQEHPGVELIRLWRHRGKGQAVRVGVLASRGADVLITDADLSTPITELEKLWTAGGDAVAVIGSRALAGSHIEIHQSRVRRLLGRLGNRYIRAVAVPGIRDTQCGFKLLRGGAARALMARTRLNGWGIDVEILHLCARFGWPVVEVPVRWRHNTGSKLHPIAYLSVLAEVAYVRVVHRRANHLSSGSTNTMHRKGRCSRAKTIASPNEG